MGRFLATVFLVAIQVLVVSDLDAVDFTVEGTVKSRLFFYDENGNPKENTDPHVRATSVCDFIFRRSNDKWRLDIVQPDSSFPENAVWRSITPISHGGFVSVIKFPPRPEEVADKNNKGNAYINIITNTIFPYEDIYGAQALWLSFNMEDLIKRYTFSNGCPPFWKFDPLRNDIRQRTYSIIHTNGGLLFWCNGEYIALDNNERKIVDNGHLKLASFPAPIDKGFPEGQYIHSSDYLDKDLNIPKTATLTFWTPFRDQVHVGGVRFVPETEITMSFEKLSKNPILASVFSPTWTNNVAIIVDSRASGITNQPLSYVTKVHKLDLSQKELDKQKKKFDFMAQNSSQKISEIKAKWPVIIIMFLTSCFPIVIIYLYFRRSNIKTNK